MDVDGDQEDVHGNEISSSAPAPSMTTSPALGSTITTTDLLQSRMMGSNVTSASLKRKENPNIPEYIGVDEDEERPYEQSYVIHV